MNQQEWERSVSQDITGDPLWTVEAYRTALFLSDICWADVTKLFGDHRMISVADQLYRSVGSISANIAEGYSRGTGKDRARFYEYALGSARESRDWYYKARYMLGQEVADHRVGLCTQLTRLLLVMIRQQRGSPIREIQDDYDA